MLSDCVTVVLLLELCQTRVCRSRSCSGIELCRGICSEESGTTSHLHVHSISHSNLVIHSSSRPCPDLFLSPCIRFHCPRDPRPRSTSSTPPTLYPTPTSSCPPSSHPTMPSTDYTSTGGGLKLKGVKNAGIDKKRKKKKQPSSSSSSTAVVTASKDSNTNNDTDTANPSQTSEPLTTTTAKQDRQKVEDALIPPQSDGKTESERRHDEMRRKRVSRSPAQHNTAIPYTMLELIRI